MIDPLLTAIVAAIGTACLLSAAFGWMLGFDHGRKAALSDRLTNEMAGHWPTPLQGDLPHIPVHEGKRTDG